MIHVAHVERSAAFYALLGFQIGNRTPPIGKPRWAGLYAPGTPDPRKSGVGIATMTAR